MKYSKEIFAAIFLTVLTNNDEIRVAAQEGIPVGAAPIVGFPIGQECSIHNADSEACAAFNIYTETKAEKELEEVDVEDEEDPMLEEMPGIGFKAYKRADISSFYQEPPGSRTEMKPAFNGQAGKFVNMSPTRLQLSWDDGNGPPGSPICYAGPFESCGTATFPGHVFYLLDPDTNEVACSFRMDADTAVYFCDPFVKNDPDDPSSGVYQGTTRDLSDLDERQRELYDAATFNRKFGALYKNFTGGSEWLANFPSQPPQHFMWRADYFGQTHHVESAETHFTEYPPGNSLSQLSLTEMSSRSNQTSLGLPFAQYRESGTLNITLEVVSVAPRILQIEGFLSEVEVEHLLDLATGKNLQRSTTGMGGKDSHVSNTRTSRTTWLPRHSSPILDAIIRRGADVLRIDEALMRPRLPSERPDFPGSSSISEDLQIVHYNQGQQYTAHHDFGYPDTRPNAPSRSINLCMYLNEGMEGGETAFPRWRNAHTPDAVKAVPKKGKAMIFYMKNPDGNLDDLSQHAAMPVVEGEKWFANLWTWDPLRE